MSIKNLRETVLVTGGGGYLGTVFVPLLLKKRYRVKVLDRFFFGKDKLLSAIGKDKCIFIESDIRHISKDMLHGVDVVVDLASLASDRAGELDAQKTMDINFHARVQAASLAKKMGVKRYILASTCSVYGYQKGLLNEATIPTPITLHAKASLFAEQAVLSLQDKNFTVTALRQAVLYGFSPRMRFDLVVNAMVLSLYREGVITIWGDGTQWRLLLHVKDSALAFIRVMEGNSGDVGGEIFNVGETRSNYQISTVAQQIMHTLGIPGRIILKNIEYQDRSFRVSCEKINKIFKPQYNLAYGAQDVYNALVNGAISETLQTKTLDWYKALLAQDPKVFDAI